MSADAKQARDDLAFMKALVEGQGGLPKNFGLLYFLGGASYGVQVLIQGLAAFGFIPLPAFGHLIVGFAPTIFFVGALCIVLWRDRKEPITGATQRGLNGAFGATGLANLALALIFAMVALQQENFLIWLLFPIVVFVLQGSAWYLAYLIQRRRWVLIIAVGWYATAFVMALTVSGPQPYYIVATGGGLIAFMAVPGLILMRRKNAAG